MVIKWYTWRELSLFHEHPCISDINEFYYFFLYKSIYGDETAQFQVICFCSFFSLKKPSLPNIPLAYTLDEKSALYIYMKKNIFIFLTLSIFLVQSKHRVESFLSELCVVRTRWDINIYVYLRPYLSHSKRSSS